MKYPYTFVSISMLFGVISRDVIGSVAAHPKEVVVFVAVVSTITYFLISKLLDYLVSNSIKKNS